MKFKDPYTPPLKDSPCTAKAQRHHNHCTPKCDSLFLNNAHLGEINACASFPMLKSLKPNRWILSDDCMDSIETSAWWHKTPSMKNTPEDFLQEQQAERIVTPLLSQHPDIESMPIRGNWARDRKLNAARPTRTPPPPT